MNEEVKTKLNTAEQIVNDLIDWMNYVRELGNECAYTDDWLRKISNKLDSMRGENK